MRRAFAVIALFGLVVAGLLPAASAQAATARFGGADRIEVAVGISQQFDPGVPVVYIAKESNYPDALTAAPAAALQGGPLLLAPTAWLPASVVTELERLEPQRIVVVGGVNSISTEVYSQLSDLAPSISRVGGVDRYEASRNLVTSVFAGAPMPRLYIATGANFPDALSAGAAAGSLGAPVLLVDGLRDSLDSPTQDLIASLDPDQIVVAGGPVSVPVGIEDDLRELGAPDGVLRLSGADRYETAIAVSSEAIPEASATFIATGENFPDALTGSAWAGRTQTPLLLVTPDCAPQGVVDYVTATGIVDVTAFGGPVSVSDTALNMVSCNEYRTPTAHIVYSCQQGLGFDIRNPNVTSVEATVSADNDGDGVLDEVIMTVDVPAGFWNGYGAVRYYPDGSTTTVVIQAKGEVLASLDITPECDTDPT